MAGSGWRTFTAGAVLTAAQVQNYLQDQAVQVYASAATRTSALGTSVATGMVSYRTDGTAVEYYNGTSWVSLADNTSVATLTNKVLSNPSLTGSAQEAVTVVGTGFAGYTFDALTSSVVFITANATANGTVNIRGNSGTTLNSTLSVGESVTVTLAIKNGTTAYYPTAWQIDGVALTAGTNLFWVGSAPAAGNASAFDVYSVTIIKTAATPTYSVLASQTKFA